MREDVGEAQQQRRVQAASLQRLHHLQHVDGVAACVTSSGRASADVTDLLAILTGLAEGVAARGLSWTLRGGRAVLQGDALQSQQDGGKPTHRCHGAARPAGRDPRRESKVLPSRRRCRAPPNPAGPTPGLAPLSQHATRLAPPPASLPPPDTAIDNDVIIETSGETRCCSVC